MLLFIFYVERWFHWQSNLIYYCKLLLCTLLKEGWKSKVQIDRYMHASVLWSSLLKVSSKRMVLNITLHLSSANLQRNLIITTCKTWKEKGQHVHIHFKPRGTFCKARYIFRSLERLRKKNILRAMPAFHFKTKFNAISVLKYPWSQSDEAGKLILDHGSFSDLTQWFLIALSCFYYVKYHQTLPFW